MDAMCYSYFHVEYTCICIGFKNLVMLLPCLFWEKVFCLSIFRGTKTIIMKLLSCDRVLLVRKPFEESYFIGKAFFYILLKRTLEPLLRKRRCCFSFTSSGSVLSRNLGFKIELYGT